MTQRGPNVRVANLGTSDLVEQLAVHVPGNGLGLPGRRGAVPDDAPRMPRLIRDGDASPKAIGLVADAARVDVAVGGAVARQLAIDGLEDVKFTALGPWGSRADRVAQDPESRPDPLFGRGRVAAEPDIGLGERELPRTGREDVLTLEPA